MTRYCRQEALPEVGTQGQEKLRQGAVLCVGVGGLGSPALLYLAAAGVGKIGIIDFDAVDESNLQRQILFTEADIGRPKTEAAAKRLNALNSQCHIQTYQSQLDAQNAEHIFNKYDVIIDGSDNFATRFLVNDAAVKCGKPLVYGAIQGFDGQVAVFDGRKGSCYRCLHPKQPEAPIRNCAEAGVIGSVAGFVGVTQAQQAIYLLLEESGGCKALRSTLWVLNSKTMSSRTFNVPKNKNCPVCSLTPENITLTFTAPFCQNVTEVIPDDLKNLPSDTLFIDVREEDELADGMIKNAHHLPLSALIKTAPSLPKNRCYVAYCQSGHRSLKAASILEEAGFKPVYSLRGGYKGRL